MTRQQQLQRERNRRYYAANKEALKAYQRQYQVENRDAVRERKRKYEATRTWPNRRRSWVRQGIDAVEAERLLRAHNGRCDICATKTPGGIGGWHVDHDHVTGQIRGILCHRCNTGMAHIDRVGTYAFERYLRPEMFTADGPVANGNNPPS